MEKKFEDEELDQLIDEQFIKEAQMMEEAIFSDDDSEDYEASDEEIKASYQKLVDRLKADGIYREDDKAEDTADVPETAAAEDKMVPIAKKRTPAFRRKFAKAAGFVVVSAMCVFAASMTSEANRNYVVESIKLLTGNDTQVIVGNDERNEDVDTMEYEAEKYIKEKLGIDVPEFLYRPVGFEICKYEADSYAQIARIEYNYRDSIIELCIDKKEGTTSSKFDSVHGGELEIVNIESENIEVEIRKIQDEQDEMPNYLAQWERNNVYYYMIGKIELEELIKIIELIKY